MTTPPAPRPSLAAVEMLAFPDAVLDATENSDWSAFIALLDAGLPAMVRSRQEGTTLFEWVLACADSHPQVQPLPLSVLAAFDRAGLAREAPPGGLGPVALAAQAGQWRWAGWLSSRGYPVEEPHAAHGTLYALMRGCRVRQQYALLETMGQTFRGMMDHALQGVADRLAATPGPTPHDLGSNVIALPLPSADEKAEQAALQSTLDEGVKQFFEHSEQARRNQGMAPVDQALASALFRELLAAGADPHRLDPPLVHAGVPAVAALPQAVLSGQHEWVDALLTAPLAQAPTPEELMLAARVAVPLGDPILVRLIWDRTPPEHRGAMAAEAWSHAVLHDRPKILSALAAAGVDLDVPDAQGWTVLQRAAHGGAHRVLDHLIHHAGANPHALPAVGPSAADLLRHHHPELGARWGIVRPTESGNVRLLRPRR